MVSSPVELLAIFIERQVQTNERSGAERESPKTGLRTGSAPNFRNAPLPEPADRVFGQHQRVVILGDPGQGKTRLLRQYAVALAEPNESARLPVLVELGRKRTISEQTDKQFSWMYERLPPTIKDSLGKGGRSMCVGAINSGKAAILLDGLDELEPETQKQMQEQISAVKGNQLVMTSPPHSYRLIPFEGFDSYRLQELQPAACV